MHGDWLREQAADLAGEPEYELEKLMLSIQRQLAERMDECEVNQSGLARLLNVGRWGISRLLNNVGNVEIRTLVRIASALKCRVTVDVERIAATSVSRAYTFESMAVAGTVVRLPGRSTSANLSLEFPQPEGNRGFSAAA